MTFVWKHTPDDFFLELPDGEDNSKTIADWDGVTTSVLLTGRKLWKDGDWNTICLPFGYSDFSAFGTDEEIRYLDTDFYYDASGNTQWEAEMNANFIYRTGFDEATGTLRLYFGDCFEIEAGTPYLIKWAKDTEHPYIENPLFSNVLINKTMNPAISADGTVAFTGTYDPITFTATDRSILFLGTENTLYYPEAGASIGAFRGYFQLNGISAGNISATRLFFGDEEETGISEKVIVKSEQFATATGWYTLDGRRLNGRPTAKGLYIHGGRTVVIRSTTK